LSTVWQTVGLLVLGGLAAGMTAFPAGTLSVFAPVSGGLAYAWRAGLGMADSLRFVGSAGTRAVRSVTALARETQELERQIQTLEQKTVLKEEQQRELVRLHRLLQLKDDLGGQSLTARVIGGDPSTMFSSLILDVGANEGLHEGMAVVAPAGAVGRLLSVGPTYATALWLCDPRSRVAAFVQRTRVMGVLIGTGSGCELRYLAAGDDVKVGDRVLTAGRGSAFPKGILVGVVKELRRDGLLLAADIAPAVSVRRLEEVLVLTRAAPVP
jgi:rod shape-determining protein MreC